MADYRSEDLYAEAEAEQAEAEAEIAATPATDAGFDEVAAAAHFDAAVTASRERVSGVYTTEAAPQAPDIDGDLAGGSQTWGY